MPVWTPGERRGALLVVLLLCLGAARDLWRATHPVPTPPPADRVAPGGGTSAPLGDGGTVGSASGGATAAPVVDLNRAGPAELDALPGIGPVLAERIIRHRSRHGPFRDPEDLLAVPGIGPRLLERLRPRVRAGVPARSVGPLPDSAAGNPAAARRGVAFGNPASGGRVQIPVQERPAGGR